MKKIGKMMFGLAACACFFLPAVGAEAKEDVTMFRDGVYLEDVSLSGMTVEEVDEVVQSKVDEALQKTFILSVEGNDVEVTGEELGIYSKNLDDIEDALYVGYSGNVIDRYKAIKDLEHTPVVYDVVLTADADAIKKVLEEKCSEYNQPAVDATIKRENGSFVITEGQTGIVVDVDATTSGLQNFIETEWTGEDAFYTVTVTTEEPRGTKEELAKIKDVLGTFHTSYSSSGSNRSGNVANGTKLIDGAVLYPDEEFSVYNAVSPFTEANGYYMAGSYLNGQVVESFGGGICQVSTTLYNAVLLAELDVVERYNHSMIVSYVDPSADAAIAGTYKDFKFKNNTEAPIYIEGYTSSDKKIYFTIYGQETRDTASRKVAYESKVIQTKEPGDPKITTDSSMALGTYSTSSAHTGYVAELYKIVTVDGVETERTLVNKSTYQASPQTIVVGIKSKDADAVKAMKAAVKNGDAALVKRLAAAYKSKDSDAKKDALSDLSDATGKDYDEDKEDTKSKDDKDSTKDKDSNSKDKDKTSKDDSKDKDTTKDDGGTKEETTPTDTPAPTETPTETPVETPVETQTPVDNSGVTEPTGDVPADGGATVTP